MISSSVGRIEGILNQLQTELRERVGRRSDLKLSARGNTVHVEGRVPTFYLKQIILNAVARGLPLDVDAKGLVVD